MIEAPILVCPSVLSPWHIAAIRWGQQNNFSFVEKQSPVLRQPWWQRLIERATFKHRAAALESAPSFVSMHDDQAPVCIDIRGTNDVIPGKNLLLKPFFNNSFDVGALAATLINEQVPVLGWAGRISPEEPWRVLAKADIAVRDPLGLEGALFLCGERLGALLEHAWAKKHFGEIFIPDEMMPRVSFFRLALKQLRVRLKNMRWWLFASPARAYIPNWDELVLFYADDPFGDWHPHPANPIVQSATGGRMAGSLFEHEGHLFRPGQDCRGGYGRGVVFAHIDTLTPEAYQETLVPCPVHLPEKVPGRGQWHTFAYSNSWCVLDYKKRSFITRHLRTHPTNPAQNPCTPGHRYDDQRRQFSEGMLRCGK
jgi:hypothetical protein